MRFKRNEPLAKHTTFKIGGPADLFFVAKNSQDLKKAVQSAQKLKIPYFVLGRGSNLLVSDKGFRGLVIKNNTSRIRISGEKVEADSGVLTAQLVKRLLIKAWLGWRFFLVYQERLAVRWLGTLISKRKIF